MKRSKDTLVTRKNVFIVWLKNIINLFILPYTGFFYFIILKLLSTFLQILIYLNPITPTIDFFHFYVIINCSREKQVFLTSSEVFFITKTIKFMLWYKYHVLEGDMSCFLRNIILISLFLMILNTPYILKIVNIYLRFLSKPK